jgi:hypothetical protein
MARSQDGLVKHHGLIFTDHSVLAMRAGLKTQSRRLVKLNTKIPTAAAERDLLDGLVKCPHGDPGDLIWAREAWRDDVYIDASGEHDVVVFRAGHECADELKWRSPLFLEKRHARIWRRLDEVRVQRVQDITNADARAEGMPSTTFRQGYDARAQFCETWDSINGKRAGASWAANPWVWALTFSHAERPEFGHIDK